MSLLQSFKQSFSPQTPLFVAVSGGLDSVVLCELCKQAGYSFTILHCNFQLRGEESERDEKFVRGLGEKYNVKVFVEKFDTENIARQSKRSIQETARELRYAWFWEMAQQVYKANHPESVQSSASGEQFTIPADALAILTAHHRDDNIETVLMNFCRGTGLHGLTGIPAGGQQGAKSWQAMFLKRPLLSFSKEQLLQFAKENNLAYVEDSSNASTKYTRNLFRHEIIPAIEKVYPQVKENLHDNIQRFTEIEKLYRLAVDGIKKKLCKEKNNEIHIPVKQLMGYNNKALIYEIIAEHGFSEKQVDELIKLAGSESGRYIESAQKRIIRHRHWFIISPLPTEAEDHFIIEPEVRDLHFPGGKLKLEKSATVQPATGREVACLDRKYIRYPLLLRKWKTGDYFYPLGMRKKKKLARFLIDQKLSKTDKEKIWVIEMDKKIVWVVGHRIDDRFKLTDNTKEVLQISFSA